MEQRDDPSNPSIAYVEMHGDWKTIDDILAGPERIRKAAERYLPKNPAESQAEYDRRRKSAPWQPEFEDILRGLTSKPFAKDIGIRDGASQPVMDLAEDIDGKGSNLTAFAQPVFRGGVAKGCAAIMVEYTEVPKGSTLADARALGARPYWVAICADDIIDLKTAFVGGRELAYHVRIKECRVERDGYAEKTVERIRELNREPALDGRGEVISLGLPTWEIWEKQQATGTEDKWVSVGSGGFAPLTEIPIALFWTNEREGAQFVRPPLYAIADKQIELYNLLSAKSEAFRSVGFPMYSANGMGPPAKGETIETGPNRILFAAGQGASWSVIAAPAASLQVLLEDVKVLVEAIRRLGMQPITQRTGTATATEIAIEGARAHSALEAWANGFKDVLEQALKFTSQWLGEDPNVEIDWTIDFLAGLADQPSLDALQKARAAKDISREAYIQGLKRFGVLPSDFDTEADEELLAVEMQGLEPEPAAPGLPDPAIQQPPIQQAA